MEILQEDLYSFLGHTLQVKSNSGELLSHLRSMYGRFHLDSDGRPSRQRWSGEKRSKLAIKVIDDLSGSNELTIHDNYYRYRLSKEDGNFYVTRQKIDSFDNDLEGFCDPFTLLQVAILKMLSLQVKDYHLFHAGSVSWKKRGIIFPATSGMGKTTLVLKLLSFGAKFLSDEVACFDSHFDTLEPFPRKINLRYNSGKLLNLVPAKGTMEDEGETGDWEWSCDVDEIFPDSLGGPCKPGYIIFLRGFGDAPRFEPVSSPDALFELLRSCISPPDNLASALLRFAPLLNKVKSFNLVVGNPADTAEAVIKVVEGDIAREGDGKSHF